MRWVLRIILVVIGMVVLRLAELAPSVGSFLVVQACGALCIVIAAFDWMMETPE